MAKVKFQKISKELAEKKYSRALQELRDDSELEYLGDWGIIKIPGHGKRLCAVIGNLPRAFWDADDGWNEVPSVEFQEVDSL